MKNIDWDFEDEDDELYPTEEFMDMDRGFSKGEIWEIIQQMDKKDFLWIKNKINTK